MNRSAFSAFVVAATLGASLYDATGQMINPTVQTASARVAPDKVTIPRISRRRNETRRKGNETPRMAPNITSRIAITTAGYTVACLDSW